MSLRHLPWNSACRHRRWLPPLKTPTIAPRGQQIPAPDCLNLHNAWEGPQILCPPFIHEHWLDDLQHWRAERRIRIAYDPSRYDLPAFQWTQSSFMQPQMMVQDRYFYDPAPGRYTVDRYLDDLEKRYGGIDAVLVWATYPNMGIDDRNQLEMVESMPGGVEGVRQMVADFHRRGVRVLFPMMMWDQGTHAAVDSPGRRPSPTLMKADRRRRHQRRHAGRRPSRLLARRRRESIIHSSFSPKAAPAMKLSAGT